MKICIIQFIAYFCIIFPLTGCSQETEFKDFYNLKFDNRLIMLDIDNTWKVSGCLSNILSRDTIHVKEGKASARIEINTNNTSSKNSFHIYQLLKLPSTVKEIEISFWIRSEYLTDAFFTVSTLDSLERISRTNKIPFGFNPEWTKYTTKIENKHGRMLYVEFNIVGNAKIWLDDLEILLNSQDFYKFSMFSEKLYSDNRPQIKSTPKTIEISHLFNDLNSKKIIGIGETCHGVHEMASLRNRLIKSLVLKKRCRLVILEAPDTYVEHLNKFIQGVLPDKGLFMREDIARAQFYNLSEEVYDLLKWIKQFNSKAKEKVIVAGMDVSWEWQELLRKSFHDIKNNIDIVELNNHLMKSESDSMLILLSKHKNKMISEIGENKFDSLFYMATKLNQFTKVYSSFFDDKTRDSIMAQNVFELIQRYAPNDKKVVVCGHLSHLNKQKLDNSVIPSVGNYISNKLNDKYFVIGLMINKGYYQAYQITSDKLNVHPLAQPIRGSIEYYMSKTESNNRYVNIDEHVSLFNDIMTYRHVGGIPKNQQFYPGNIALRLDAIIPICNGSPLHLLPIFEIKVKKEL